MLKWLRTTIMLEKDHLKPMIWKDVKKKSKNLFIVYSFMNCCKTHVDVKMCKN